MWLNNKIKNQRIAVEIIVHRDSDNDFEPYLVSGKALEKYFDLMALQAEFHKLFNETEKNDRAIAIVGAAFLDTLLEHILFSFLADDDKNVQQIVGFDKALGTFSSRIKMVYGLGLIYEPVRNDLEQVRKIRNKFAHTLDVSFEDQQIKDWCQNLEWHRKAYVANPPEGATAQELFQVGVNQLIGYLSGVISIARGEKRKIPKYK
jgi:DNA-binding MltR family transcriptional regulator